MAKLGSGPRPSDAEGCMLVHLAGLSSSDHCSTRIKVMTLTLNLITINFCKERRSFGPRLLLPEDK